jgi:alkaline phosphatase
MFKKLSERRLLLMMLVLIVLASACMADGTPRNIILLIGDGMGIGHITAARCEGPGPNGRLAMDTMPITGLVLTHPANALVTDSAAAGTALATGVKTNNGIISMAPDGKRLKTILELAEEKGKSTGIISTKSITDATPAVFVAHVINRSQKEDIAIQMISSRVNVILGGGKKYFLPQSEGGSRADGRNLLDEAKKRGYDVFDTTDAMKQSTSKLIIGLFAQDSMLNQPSEPTIAEMTAKAISALAKNGKGFFLMSEGAKIDTESHGNNAVGMTKETLWFDDAVHTALDFAKKDKSTLVIVTADHETGGLAVLDPDSDAPKFKAGWVSKGHSANMVPVYAFGPSADRFSGTHDNTDIPKTFAGLWGQKLN